LIPDPGASGLADNLRSQPVKLWDPFALRELTALLRDPVFRGRGVPRGDGRPVMLIPGFLSGDWSLRMMHSWLGRIGYKSYLSGIYFNVQHSERLIAGLRHRLLEIEAETGSRVSLVGHSRGGLLAKVLSQRKPQSVEQVITLGAPLADWTDLALVTHHAVGVVRTANEIAFGRRFNAEGRFSHDLSLSPVVPTTSIYSRSDGVVNWRACLRRDLNSIEVQGSHVGLALNPEVYRILSHLLPAPWRA